MSNAAWQQARALAESQLWLLTAADARACGLTRSELDGAVRRRIAMILVAGVYLLDGDMFAQVPEDLWWRAALKAHGDDVCLVGWTGARAIGAQGLPSRDPSVDVALIGGGSRHHRALGGAENLRMADGREVVVRQWPVKAAEIELVDGMRIRRKAQTLVDAALMLDRVHAVCLFDWALHTGVMTREELDSLVAAAKRRPGVVHVRQAAELADARAESPLESRVRVACVDGHLPPDDLQYPVEDSSGLVVAYGDLAWLRRPHTKKPLIAEADGRGPHELPAAVLHDRRRANTMVGRSCDMVRFTWADALRPAYVQQAVRAALAA
jgi:hypothetical protein